MFSSANLVLMRWSSVTNLAAGSLRTSANSAVSAPPSSCCPWCALSLAWRSCTWGSGQFSSRVPAVLALCQDCHQGARGSGGRAMRAPACQKLGWHPADSFHTGFRTGVRWQRLLVRLQTSDLHYQSPEPSEAPRVSH